ncbi:FKBP-type peptidyl-prolyl cis-trans isomerase [Candidatus Saccharibacteria bacterium]|nr:FKBP-type peptidyl-prolyl cis-trans isomerase [Candidatus Saccharibacteria bacterium]
MSTSNTPLEGTKLLGFEPVASVTELQSIDLVEGTGETVPKQATITAHYTGALAADGTIFQSSHDGGQPATFGLYQVIAGWTQGVPGMKVGGTRRLIIPSALAYGSRRAAANIPPNSDLVFDIELVEIQ